MKDFGDFLFGEGGIRELTARGDYASALGSEDHFADLSTRATADYLTGQGFRVHLEVLKGVGHEYAHDTLNFWKAALAFINGSGD